MVEVVIGLEDSEQKGEVKTPKPYTCKNCQEVPGDIVKLSLEAWLEATKKIYLLSVEIV